MQQLVRQVIGSYTVFLTGIRTYQLIVISRPVHIVEIYARYAITTVLSVCVRRHNRRETLPQYFALCRCRRKLVFVPQCTLSVYHYVPPRNQNRIIAFILNKRSISIAYPPVNFNIFFSYSVLFFVVILCNVKSAIGFS